MKNNLKQKEYLKNYYKRNKQNILNKQLIYYKNNSQKIKENSIHYYQRTKTEKRNYLLYRSYGITLEDYNKILEKQNYKCAICGTDSSGGKGVFHVDHNHKTKRVRGLLCSNCNHGLGIFKDSEDILLKAIIYLKNIT